MDLSDGHILQDDELNYWVPQQALELAASFQALHLPALRPELLESLLLSLHSVWRMRERILCEKLFRNYQTKIAVLKRQLAQRKPYQEVRRVRLRAPACACVRVRVCVCVHAGPCAVL